ncbi:DUF418 domain-containing protein [Oceanobacillus senegalensis]|uniref:DUF418 domain-containing protein n=1 Tax=Oceanobacillus senegalensis TaxID=1936063 RepID=UPI000A30501F|nr:DUF418 domain-containing protein [Oceanobacillus senegalensis]
MNNDVSPIQEGKRLEWIDAARGFAIFGIFIVNIGAFGAPYFLYGGQMEIWMSDISQWTLEIIDIFFQASFYTLFSILFGFGIQMMKERTFVKGIPVYPFLVRRLTILFAMGAIHAFLIWHGDILLTYGFVGIILLLFLKLEARTKLIVGFILLSGNVVFITFLSYLSRNYLSIGNEARIDQAFSNYQSNSLSIIWMQNYQDWMYSNTPLTIFFLTLVLLPLFLFGMFLAEKRWLHEPNKHKSILWKLWTISFVLFIGLKLGPYLLGNPRWFSFAQDNVGGTFSALFYIISITLIAGNKKGQKIIKPFTYVGRMALSNYIFQSIICFILFYGIGFGLYGKVSPLLGVLMVFIIYTCQILISKWWVSRFRFGPLEWIWRSLTYWYRQPLRK